VDGVPPHFTNLSLNGSVEAVAAQPRAGHLLVAAGGELDEVTLWSLPENYHDGRLTVPEGLVLGLKFVDVSGALLVVAATGEGVVRVWDPDAGWPTGEELGRHDGAVRGLAIARVDERLSVVSGGNDGVIRTWPLGGDGPGLTIAASKARLMALATFDGWHRPLVIAGADDGTLLLADLASPDHPSELTRRDSAVWGVAATTVDGRPTAVASWADGVIEVWDVLGPTRTHGPLASPFSSERVLLAESRNASAFSLVTMEVESGPVAITGSDDGSLRFWNAKTGDLVRGPIGRHDAPITGLASGSLQGRPVLFSGDETGRIVAWDLGVGPPVVGPWVDGSALDLPDPRPLSIHMSGFGESGAGGR
jgi:eukaryotic-like serine/threonine-protein kinase